MSKLKELLLLFKQYFEFSGSSDWEIGFRCGAFLAVSTILFLTMLLLLMRLVFFRRRQIRQMELEGERGKYIIASAAISDLISAKMEQYPEVALLKTKIYPTRNKKCQIVLHINYLQSAEADNLQNLVSRIQEDVIAELGMVFGITSVDTVSVCISRAKKKK